MSFKESIINLLYENHVRADISIEGLASDILSILPEQEAIKPKWKAEDRFMKNHFFMYPYCPKCGHEIITGDCYCTFCGQHIDWSEDDD